MKTAGEILEEISETLYSVQKTLHIMSKHSNIKPDSKEKIFQNLKAIMFFHDRVKQSEAYGIRGNRKYVA
jgi:hypothetical protein